MKEKAIIMDEKAMARAVQRISYEIIERNKGCDNLCLIGILTRGIHLADRIGSRLEKLEGKKIDVGYIDITPFRDDKNGDSPEDKSKINFDIANKRLVLIDDVVYTGRSCRAAIDAIMDRGRPLNIQLAVLVDRGHRELPIRADYIGKNLPTSRDEEVRVYVTERDGCDKVVICE